MQLSFHKVLIFVRSCFIIAATFIMFTGQYVLAQTPSSQETIDKVVRLAETSLANQTAKYSNPKNIEKNVPQTLEKTLSNLRIALFYVDPELDPEVYRDNLATYSELLKQTESQRDQELLELYRLYFDFAQSRTSAQTDVSEDLVDANLNKKLSELQAFKESSDWLVSNTAHLVHASLLMNIEDMNGALDNALAAVKIIPNENTIYASEASYSTNGLVSTIYAYSANLDFGIGATEIHLKQSEVLGLEARNYGLFANLVYALMQWREYEAAEKVAKSAYTIAQYEGSERDGVVNYRYAQALNANGNYAKAEQIAGEGLTLAEPGLWTIHLESQRAIALAGQGEITAANLSLDKIDRLLIEHSQYARWFDDRIRDVRTLLAVENNDPQRVFDLMNETLVSNTQYLLRQSSDETQKLMGTLENDKALLKTREEKLQLEAQLANERADAAGKRSLLLLMLSACVVIALFAAIAFARQQNKAAIENARLKRLAESGERAKSQFLAVMSHELRTPLNGIIGLAEMLTKYRPDKDVRFKSNVILKSGLTLLDLLSNVLDVSQMETGKLGINREAASIYDLIDNLRELWTPRARRKAVEFTLHVEPAVPQILNFDPIRVRQCLENLISNAIKFTSEGRVHVHVTYAAQRKGAKGELTIFVADTGKGMSADEALSVFDAFTQADSSTTREFGGSGLGLAITRSLARMMGGDVTLNTASGRGSEFTLTLSADVVENNSTSEQDITPKFLRPSPKESILLAEAEYNDDAVLDAPQPAADISKDIKIEARAPAGGDDIVEDLSALLAPDHEQSPTPHTLTLDIAPMSAPKTLEHMRSVSLDIEDEMLASTHAHTEDLDAIFEQLMQSAIPAPSVKTQSPPELQTEPPATSIVSELKETPRNADPLRGLRVLVADDIQTNHDVLKIFLQPVGCIVTSAMNGAQAVRAVQQDHFDVILMDVRMPEMDGIEATEILKAMGGPKSDIPIIAMTADTSAQNNALCLSAGANVFLTKPLAAAELFGSIRYVLRQKENTKMGEIEPRKTA